MHPHVEPHQAEPHTLMRYQDANGQDWADVIDMLTMHPDARRRVVRLLAEIDAAR